MDVDNRTADVAAKPLRLLVVEDSPQDEEIAVREIRRGGFDVTWKRVETAEAMRTTLREKTWDLILCDYQMPQFSGLAAIALLKEIDIDIPIIIVSGAIGEETAVECMRSGAHDYLIKGNLSRLVPAIERELRETESRNKRKLAEEVLRVKDWAIESAISAIVTSDMEGNLSYVNPAFLKLWGYSSPAEVLGKPAVGFWQMNEKAAEIMEEVRTKGGWVGELVAQGKDGISFDVQVVSSLVVTQTGQPVCFYASFSDITEHKRAEEALRENELKYRALFETADDAILLFTEGSWVDCNTGALRIFGCTREQIIGANPSRFSPPVQPDGRPSEEEAVKLIGLAYTAGPQSFEWEHCRADATPFAAEVSLNRLDLGGKPHIQAIVRDVSKRKRTEEEKVKLEGQLQQAQKMETVGQLAGGVAHDFNNMLQVILSYVEMSLSKVEAGQPLQKYLLEIQRAARRSAEITGQLLAFARKQTVIPKVLDFNYAVSGTQKMIQRLVGEDISLVWMPGYDLWKVKIDPSQLDQVLANLAVNARDAIGGVGKLTIGTENVTVDEAYCATHVDSLRGEYVLLAVSDNGCGMNKETLSHLFEPYFTTKEPGKGTGLGLSTIYGIVKQNQGFINVSSEPGEGSTFKVYLPRAEGAPGADAQDMEAVTPRGGTETVLVVEDEAAILEMAQLSLEQLGYTVLSAGSPVEGLRASEEHAGRIDLLITDVVMPQMNGRQLAERLHAARPELTCLYMSGYTADVIAHRGVLDEGVSFISKPFSLATLAEKVREVLDATPGSAESPPVI